MGAAIRLDRLVGGRRSVLGGTAHSLVARYGRGWQAKVRARELRCYHAHRAGLTFSEVAQREGISRTQAYRDCVAAEMRLAGHVTQPAWVADMLRERQAAKALLAGEQKPVAAPKPVREIPAREAEPAAPKKPDLTAFMDGLKGWRNRR
jgi:hypothetical protein